MFKKSLKNQIVERRLSPRYRLKAMVKVVKDEEHTSEEIINHSLTGLFLKCNFPDQYEVNDSVTVSFEDKNGTTQAHAGQIVRKSRDGIAVQYQKKDE